MKKIIQRIIVVGLFALVGIQFIPANLNKQEVIPTSDIRHVYDIPDRVLNILETSCYDCHSNNTNYPWYSNIQPARMIMDHHVEEGKEELNFNEFKNYSDRRKKNKIKSIISQIEDGNMPIPSYALMHNDVRVSADDKKEVMKWFKTKLKD
jgi:hypothetical protein